MEVEGAKGLIVGGGRVALRKAEKMLPYGPELTVIAPDILPEFYQQRVRIINRAFCDADITQELDFVIAACDSQERNRRIYELCHEKNIPVNVVDQPQLCTFLFPSLIKRGKLSVGISTSGASPSAAIWLRKEIEKLLPEDMEQILECLQEQRREVLLQTDDKEQRSLLLKQLFEQRLEASGLEGAGCVGTKERCLECAGDAGEDGTGLKGAGDADVEDTNPERIGHAGEEGGRLGCVSLVGAGCGSREWITLEGLKLLRACDAVVYDDLIDMELLKEAPYAEKLYVGKRSHRHSEKQRNIERILLELAGQGKQVVRLKGGDPFVFGRGGEEIRFLKKNGIPWRVVPGISSALAIPAQAGIPVTHRGVSRSIHIMTAHTREDALRRDLEQFAELEGTLVFLMGLESLETIAAILMERGRDKNTPAAVLSGGNAARRYKVIGTLENIAKKARAAKAETPAVIVIGNVVALDLENEESRPLSHKRIGLTGTSAFQEKLRSRLLALGAEPVSMMRGSCLEIPAVIPWEQITDASEKWIIFTSAQGIRTFFEKCRREKIDHRRFAACKFAVIGAATGHELEGYGFSADLCPREYTSAALADALLARRKEGESVYLFCSKQGTELFTERLAEKKAECHRFDIYDTCFSCIDPEEEKPQYILFGSAGGVRALHRSGYRIEKGMTGVCIGPVCADAYRECFRAEPIIAETATTEAMVDALLRIKKDAH